MLVCKYNTYDSDSHYVYYDCMTVEEIKMVYDKADSPVFDFTIDFGDRENEQYLFSLVTSINSNSLIYEVDKKN